MSTVNGGGNIITDGLVLYLDSANIKSYIGSGTTWSDLTINGNNGTLSGALFNSSNWGSIVFDGIDDRVQVPYPNTNWGSTPWTIDFWMKIDVLGNRGVACLNSANNSDYAVNNVFFTDGKSYWYFIKNSTGEKVGVTQTTGVFAINQIFNFTMTYNGLGLIASNINFYKNAVTLTTLIGGSAGITNLNGIQIGGINYPFDGNVYSFKLYNRSLSAEEVLKNYDTTKSKFGL